MLDYLQEENEYFESAMAPHRRRIEELFEELKGRIKQEDESVPVKDGHWLFWTRFSPGEEYREHLRRPAAGGSEELILSEPELSRGTEYFRLGGMDVSDNGRYIAFSTDTDGSERYTLRFRRLLGEGEYEELADLIPDTIDDPLWLPDNRTVLYLELNEQWRPFRLRAHRLGSDPGEDTILYEEEDSSFFVDVDMTQSRAFVVISTGDHITSEIRFIPTDLLVSLISKRREIQLTLISERVSEREMEIDHHGNHLYIRTNDLH